MPFTPAHAVVALPFVRTPLFPAAIAIGAMTPDLPLFLRGTPLTYDLLHTNVVVSMLVALALLTLWYLVLRPAVRELTPTWVARRLPLEWDQMGAESWASMRAPRPGARHPIWGDTSVVAALVAISLLIGVVSHPVWDAFSHEGRWGLEVFPALAENWGSLFGYKWVQYVSGVGGTLLLAICGAIWLRRRPQNTVHRVLPAATRVLWWLSLPLILVLAWVWGLTAYGSLTAEWTPQHVAYRVLLPACAVWALLTLAVCVWVLTARRRASRG